MRMSERLPRICRRRPKKVRAVAGQFLHPLGQGHVQAAAEIGDPGLALPVPGLRGGERVLQRRELLAHRRDLLVQELDLGQGPVGRALLGLELAPEIARLALRALVGRQRVLQAPPLRLRFLQVGPERGGRLLQGAPPGAFEGEEVGQFGDLPVEPAQHRVAPGDFLRQEELPGDEDRQQEHHREQQGRQRVDVARPDVEGALAAQEAAGHQIPSRRVIPRAPGPGGRAPA